MPSELLQKIQFPLFSLVYFVVEKSENSAHVLFSQIDRLREGKQFSRMMLDGKKQISTHNINIPFATLMFAISSEFEDNFFRFFFVYKYRQTWLFSI